MQTSLNTDVQSTFGIAGTLVEMFSERLYDENKIISKLYEKYFCRDVLQTSLNVDEQSTSGFSGASK